MSFQNVEDRRKHKRILLPEHHFLACKGLEPKFEGTVSVIGAGGLFVRTRQALTTGQKVRLQVDDDALKLEVDCIVRDVSENGIGVEFSSLSSPDQRKLQNFLTTLRP